MKITMSFLPKAKPTKSLEYHACTHRGKKRAHNEDFYLLPDHDKQSLIENTEKRRKGRLFILCDGMGGANAGEVASELTATWLYREYYSVPKRFEAARIGLEKAIIKVNGKISTLASENEQYKGMGTTLVTVLIMGKKAYISSIGDSRVYLFREKKFRQITEDQSEVWDLYKRGEINKDEIRTHPRNNIITMAIGTEENMTTNDFNRYQLKVRKQDLFLICSDGLTDMVSDDDIAAVLTSETTLKRKVHFLVDLANANGGRDNITVILILI